MKKHFSFIVAVASLLACNPPSQEKQENAKSLPANQPDKPTPKVQLCFQRLNGSKKQDTTQVHLVIKGENVTGEFISLPFEKDSRKGTLRGKKTGSEIKAIWIFKQEGITDSLPVQFTLKSNFLRQKPYGVDKVTGREFLADSAAYSIVFQKINCTFSSANPSYTQTLRTDTAEVLNTIKPQHLIVAGKSIGQTTLNMKAETIHNVLGSSDKSDAAMGKAWAVWYAKAAVPNKVRHSTILYFATNMGAADAASRVKQVRVNSSFFKTKTRLGVDSKLPNITLAYPNIKPVTSCSAPGTAQPVIILDDKAAGIAFEINAEKVCVAVVVHEPHQAVNTIYTQFGW